MKIYLHRKFMHITAVAALAFAVTIAFAQGEDPLSNITLSGYGYGQYENQDSGDDGFTFGSFNPLFLYRHSDRVLFEAELEFEVEDNGETETELEYAHVDYLVNEYITLLAGRFIVPMGVFNEKLHPQWINKLPNFPLPYAGAGGHHDAIIPFNDTGVQLRGALGGGGGPVYTYAVFAVNGPSQDEHEEEDEHAEEEEHGEDEHAEEEHGEDEHAEEADDISFETGSDNNSKLSYGGRLAIMVPVESSSIEVGVSAQTGAWDDSGDLDWTGVVIDASVNCTPNFEIRGEYLWTEVDKGSKDTNPSGAWVQPALKLAALESDNTVLNNSELVFRWSHLDQDDGNGDVDGYALGAIYYLTNTLQVKGAYEFIDSDDASLDDRLILQLAFGF